MLSNAEHHFMCLLVACMSSLENNNMVKCFPHFLIRLFVFLVLICIRCLSILEINLLSVVSFVIIISHPEGCLSTWHIVFFIVQNLLGLTRLHSFTFLFISISLGSVSWRIFLKFIASRFGPVFL